jgi:hypothetical protein
MNAIPISKQTEASRGQLAHSIVETSGRIFKDDAPPVVVGAKVIAKALSCSTRYVHLLAENGTIPHYRWGKACIRFNQAAVFAALGIHTGGAA